MSNLRKSMRALNHSEEWVEIVEAACVLEGVEATRENMLQATFLVANKLKIDETTLLVDTSGVTDDEIRAAARTLKPAPEENAETPNETTENEVPDAKNIVE